LNRVLLIIGLFLVAYSLVMFAIDILPVDMFNNSNNDQYLKVVEIDSISWSSYRIHALIVGSVLISISKFTNFFNE